MLISSVNSMILQKGTALNEGLIVVVQGVIGSFVVSELVKKNTRYMFWRVVLLKEAFYCLKMVSQFYMETVRMLLFLRNYLKRDMIAWLTLLVLTIRMLRMQ